MYVSVPHDGTEQYIWSWLWVRNDRFQTNEYVTFNFDADYLRVLREHFVDNSHLIHPLIHGNFIWEICCGWMYGFVCFVFQINTNFTQLFNNVISTNKVTTDWFSQRKLHCKQDGEEGTEEDTEEKCTICLSILEEGEDVR